MNYFAYGSNMAVDQMADRCPGAIVLGRGAIRGFAFRINRYGVATIVPPNGTVHGMLWDITPEHEADLDDYEGVRESLYSKAQFRVLRPDRTAVEALVYVAANSQAGRPRPRYLGPIIRAARDHGLPPYYVAELERWQAS